MRGGTTNVSTRRWSFAQAHGIPEAVENDVAVPRSRPPTGPKEIVPGCKIGRYVIQRQLGRGGMGIVYGAIDPELGRRVAIKLVRSNDDGSPLRFTARLRREAQALARISHPNIIALYDIGTTNRGSFMAVEYLHGDSIRHWLRHQERTTKEILAVFAQAGRGLAAAHAAGVIHRDFKPTNVMVGRDGHVKVLDFGLARGTPASDPWLDARTEDLLSTRMTRADVVVGTTGYMAPEQLLGGDVGPWSDQFSFCVTLFEALYGERPYPGENPVEVAASFNERRLNEPSDRRGVPQRVHQAVLRGLSVDPAGRFPTMNMLLDAMFRPRGPRWHHWVGIVALFCTAFASAAGTLWWSRHRQASSRELPVAAPLCEDAEAMAPARGGTGPRSAPAVPPR